MNPGLCVIFRCHSLPGILSAAYRSTRSGSSRTVDIKWGRRVLQVATFGGGNVKDSTYKDRLPENYSSMARRDLPHRPLALEHQNAADVGANANEHGIFGLHGLAPVVCIGRLRTIARVGVGQLRRKFGSRSGLSACAVRFTTNIGRQRHRAMPAGPAAALLSSLRAAAGHARQAVAARQRDQEGDYDRTTR
jgi:hypothetical protein